MITEKEDCIKIKGKDALNKNIKFFHKEEIFYLKDNKLYRNNGLFGLSFVCYNEV